MFESLIHNMLRRASWVVATWLLIAGVSGYYTVRLYGNLRPDLQELLPTQERSVVDLNEISRRLRSIDSLTVLVFASDAEAGRHFVDALASELKQAPPEIIAGVEYRISDEIEFFKTRRALYMDLEDLARIRKYIRDRIDYETNIRNPLNIFSGIEIPIPQLDLNALRQEYESRIDSFSRFPGGYYATPDGTKRALLVNAPGRASDVENAKRLRATVDAAIARLKPAAYAPDLKIAFTGGVQNIIDEQEALVEDLIRSSIVVAVIIVLAMGLYFRSIQGTFALLSSVFMATLATFAVAYFTIGYLNANSAFLGSIVIGNGINVGIIVLARTLECRRQGIDIESCLMTATRLTATSTWTAALAAGLSYGSLMITEFRGFRQFGVIGLIGMVLCWISAFTFLPAMMKLLSRNVDTKKTRPSSRFYPRFIARFARPIWILSVISTAFALAYIPKYSPDVIEANLSKLRSKRSLEEGSGHYAKTQDEIFKRYLSPTVILPRTQEQAREIAKRLKDFKSKDPSGLIASVQTLDDFIPQDQAKKIQLLREIKSLLPERLLRELPPKERRLAMELIRTPLRPIARHHLPPLIVDKFAEKNGRIGNLVLVEPPLGERSREREHLLRFVSTLRFVTDSVSPGAPVAGTLPVSADTLSSVARDGPKATVLSLIAVVLLVSVLFHNLWTIASVLLTLAIGSTWFLGIILAFDMRINFLNFIALPLTFGLGVDYGVNIFQRYRQEGPGGMGATVQSTGAAVALCCFTTVVGYGSLLIAQNRAFKSFGELAVLGALCCLIAAVVSVPAYRMLRDQHKNHGKKEDEPRSDDTKQELKRAM